MPSVDFEPLDPAHFLDILGTTHVGVSFSVSGRGVSITPAVLYAKETMSTRGSFGVRINGTDKLMYNHSDSYPEGLGREMVGVVRDILKEKGMDWLRERAAALQMIDSDSKPTQEQIELLKPFTDLSVSECSEEDWYCLTRRIQGDLKAHLELGIGCDGSGFIKDSLFCEWAYIVNLDENKLEVYKGFQRKPHDKGRYSSIPPCEDHHRPNVYYPCALFAEFPLDNLPDPRTFVKKMNELREAYEKAEYDENEED